MNWFEEVEGRARRSKGGGQLAHSLAGPLTPPGVDPRHGSQVARGLAQTYLLGQDLVLLVDDLFILVDGDRQGLLAWLLQLEGLLEEITWYLGRLEMPLINLLAALQLDDEPPLWQPPVAAEAQERLAFGSYSEAYRYLFERVELKLAAAGATPELAATFAGHLADTYEALLKGQERIWRLAKGQPHFRELADWLLDLNAYFHFQLLPNHLEGLLPGGLMGRLPGLPTALRLARQGLLGQP